MKPGYHRIVTSIAALALILLLAGIQVLVNVAWILPFPSCTRYVHLATAEFLVRWVWLIWAISSLANLAVLLLFLWAPIRALTTPALVTLGAFAIWRFYSLVTGLAGAGNCGQSRDYDPVFEIPFYLEPLFDPLLVLPKLLALFFFPILWAIMVACAVWALFTTPDRRQALPPST